MQTKTCTKCGTEKPLTEFYTASCSKDGRKGECKECLRTRHRIYSAEMQASVPKAPSAPNVITLAEASVVCQEKMGFKVGRNNLIGLVRKYPQLGESKWNKTGSKLKLTGLNANRWRGFLDGRGQAKNPRELFEEIF